MKNDYEKHCESFHPMKYTGDGHSYVIARGNYRGLEFLVVNNRGMCPCGYVNAKGTKYEGKHYDNIHVDCHGGLTFSKKEFILTGETGWWLGWDYGHVDDRVQYENEKMTLMHSLGRKLKTWHTGEVVKECMHVIDQLKENEQ